MYFWPGDQLGQYAQAGDEYGQTPGTFALVNCTTPLPSGFIEKICWEVMLVCPFLTVTSPSNTMRGTVCAMALCIVPKARRAGKAAPSRILISLVLFIFLV